MNMALGLNTSALKSWKLWLAVLTVVLGQLMTNGVVMSGSQAAVIVGWVLSIIAAVSGHGVPTLPAPPVVDTVAKN